MARAAPPTLDQLGPWELASRAGGFLAGVFNLMNSSDFTEQDRIMIRKAEQLGVDAENLPQSVSRMPGLLRVLTKLRAHGATSVADGMEAARVKMEPEQMAMWDSAIQEMEDMAQGELTTAEEGKIQFIGEQLTRFFGGAQATGAEGMARRGVRDPRGLTTMQTSIGQAGETASKNLGRALDESLDKRRQMLPQVVQARAQRQSAGFAQNFQMADYINKFNQWSAGMKDMMKRYSQDKLTDADKYNIDQARRVNEQNVRGKYEAERTDDANRVNEGLQRFKGKATALGIEGRSRTNLTNIDAKTEAGQQRGIRGIGEGLPAFARMFTGRGEEETEYEYPDTFVGRERRTT